MTASFREEASTALMTAFAPSRFRRSEARVFKRLLTFGSEEGGGGYLISNLTANARKRNS